MLFFKPNEVSQTGGSRPWTVKCGHCGNSVGFTIGPQGKVTTWHKVRVQDTSKKSRHSRTIMCPGSRCRPTERVVSQPND